MIDAIFEAGQRAFQEGAPTSHCPYREGSEKSKWWHEGYYDAEAEYFLTRDSSDDDL